MLSLCRSFSWLPRQSVETESYLVIAVIYFVLCFVFDKLFKLIEKKLQGKTDYALAVEYMDNE